MLIDFSSLSSQQIEMGTLHLEFSAVEIWQTVQKCVASFHLQAKQKSICLEVKSDAALFDGVVLVGDCIRVAQVFRNLISNALKFTPEHGKITFAGLPYRSKMNEQYFNFLYFISSQLCWLWMDCQIQPYLCHSSKKVY